MSCVSPILAYRSPLSLDFPHVCLQQPVALYATNHSKFLYSVVSSKFTMPPLDLSIVLFGQDYISSAAL